MNQNPEIPFAVWKITKEVRFEAVRSRGPGGQNVNKVSSAAILYWNPYQSVALSQEQKITIATKLANSMNSESEIYLRSDEFRDQERNKSRCIEKLIAMLRAALFKPKPRRATKPTRGSKERNLKAKAIRSDVKAGRRKISQSD
jgi:ribosome-associated protein